MIGVFAEPDDPAATPLTPQEMCALIPAYIVYRHELNEAEQENIISRQGVGSLPAASYAVERRLRPATAQQNVRRCMVPGRAAAEESREYRD